MESTVRLILRQPIDIILLGLTIFGGVVGVKVEGIPTIVPGMLFMCAAYITNSIRFKVWLAKSGLLEKKDNIGIWKN